MGKVSLGYIYIICGGFRRIEYIIQLKYSNSSDVFLMYHEQPQPAYAFSVSPTFSLYVFNKKECYSVLLLF
jgi:hypothetical protein